MLRSQCTLLSLATPMAMPGLLLRNAQRLMQQVLEERFAAQHPRLELLGAHAAIARRALAASGVKV